MSEKYKRKAPLAGIRVLDLSRVLAGPFCTMILADLGAEVVKIECPEVGDDARHFGPFLPSGLSGYFASINRGKKSVELNLKESGDRETFKKLVKCADVLVENFRPETMKSLGFSSEVLKKINPRLIYASVCGFGKTGLHGNKPAYDIIIQAMSGLMSITGTDPAHPVRVGTSISDIIAGMFTVIGILSALRLRDTDGQGTEVDVAMLDSTVAVLENAISRFDITGEVPYPLGTKHPSVAPFQGFKTSDGTVVIAAGNNNLWKKLCIAIGRPELMDDSRFRTNDARTQNQKVMTDLLCDTFQLMNSKELLSRLEEAGVPCAPIRNMADVVADKHLKMRGMLHVIKDGKGAEFRTAGLPIHFNGESLRLSDRVPELGEHTKSVLKEWLEIN